MPQISNKPSRLALLLASVRRNRFEVAVLGVVLGLSLALHAVLMDPTFNGPDAISNFQFAELGQDWSYWLDPDAFWGYLFPMGYGTFLAMVARITGGSLALAQWLQVFMALSMAIAGWFMTRHISRSARVATVIGISFSPALFWLARTNGYEILLSFSTTMAVAILWGRGGLHSHTRPWAVLGPTLAGLLMGVAMLSQGKVSIVMPALLFLAWRWGRVPLFAFVAASGLLPFLWSVRNLFVLDRFYPFNSSSEVVIWMGNNWETQTGGYVLHPPPLPEGFNSYYEASLNFVLNQPERAFSLLLTRMARLLEPTYLYLPSVSVRVNVLLHFVLIVLAITGALLFAAYLFGRLWVSPPRIPRVGAIAVVVLLFTLVHLPFATETRHLKPIVPLALCVAMPTAVTLWSRATNRIRSKTLSDPGAMA